MLQALNKLNISEMPARIVVYYFHAVITYLEENIHFLFCSFLPEVPTDSD